MRRCEGTLKVLRGEMGDVFEGDSDEEGGVMVACEAY